MNWEDQLDVAGMTDVGMRRSNNQDSYRILPAPTAEQWRSRGHVFVVADGMGAHAVGELASKMAVDVIPHTYHKLAQLPCADAIVKAFQDANGLIHNRGVANSEFKGMGTTSTALILLPEGALIAHVGDSRAYRIRDGEIEQLSFDHSWAWELVRQRRLTLEQARTMVPNNVITRSLGPEADVQVDVEGPYPIQPGDVFVLCSDGLSGQVGDAEIGAMSCFLAAQEGCQNLVDMANLQGGPDNITLIIVRVQDRSISGNGKSPSKPSPRPSQKNYANYCVAAGSGLLGLALALTVGRFVWGPLSAASGGLLGPLAVLGLAGLAAGFVWRWMMRSPEQRAAPAKRATFRPPASCRLDKALFDRLLQRLQQLHKLAVERAWNVDWTEFFSHRQAAEKFIAAGDTTRALREIGKAQHLLAIAQRRFVEETQELLGGA